MEPQAKMGHGIVYMQQLAQLAPAPFTTCSAMKFPGFFGGDINSISFHLHLHLHLHHQEHLGAFEFSLEDPAMRLLNGLSSLMASSPGRRAPYWCEDVYRLSDLPLES